MDVYFIKQQKMSHFQINDNSSNQYQNGWKYLETIAGKIIYKKITEKLIFLTTWHYLLLTHVGGWYLVEPVRKSQSKLTIIFKNLAETIRLELAFE